jgi:hypothetical protein
MLDEVRISDIALEPNEFLHPVPAIYLPDISEGFESNFIGIDDSDISTLPEWEDASTYGSTRRIDNNEGKFAMQTNGWIYPSIRANDVFDPISEKGGLRFEYLVKEMTDSSSNTIDNATSRLCLANTSLWNGPAWDMNGEKLVLGAKWNKGSNNLDITLRIINKLAGDPISDIGVNAYVCTALGVDMDGGDQFKLAMELRDDSESNDVRVGYQLYDYITNTWSNWVYSQWFDPTDEDGTLGLDDDPNNNSEFGTNWKANWTDNTYFYIEQYCPNGRTATVWIDDVMVTKR